MSGALTGRIIISVVFGILVGIWLNWYRRRTARMTLEQYLERRQRGYEKLCNYRHGLVPELFAGVVLVGLFVGAYEILAFGVRKWLGG